MDRNQIRQAMLTGFKPKERDLPTPYLVLPDGTSLDGELKLVGMTGREAIDLVEKCTEHTQTVARDGTVTDSSKVNGRKLTALRIAACLRVRETGENIYDLVDVVGEENDGKGA